MMLEQDRRHDASDRSVLGLPGVRVRAVVGRARANTQTVISMLRALGSRPRAVRRDVTHVGVALAVVDVMAGMPDLGAHGVVTSRLRRGGRLRAATCGGEHPEHDD